MLARDKWYMSIDLTLGFFDIAEIPCQKVQRNSYLLTTVFVKL